MQIVMVRLFVLITICVSLIGCASPDYDNERPQPSQAAAAPIPYPPGEYMTTAKMTPAAASADYYILAIKAAARNDFASIRTLRDTGLCFDLPKGTRLMLLPAEVGGAQLQTSLVGTVNDVPVCVATVESGDRIGAEVALGCESLDFAGQ